MKGAYIPPGSGFLSANTLKNDGAGTPVDTVPAKSWCGDYYHATTAGLISGYKCGTYGSTAKNTYDL